MNSNQEKGKSTSDLINDGILSYGVIVGRLVFEEEGYVVYVVSDLPHVGPSDVYMLYQISRADYDRLLALSEKHSIPHPPVPKSVTDACCVRFLCGDSAYCARYYCTLDDVDLTLAERIPRS